MGHVSCVTAAEASCPDRVQLEQQLLCDGNATAFVTAGRRLGGVGKAGAGVWVGGAFVNQKPKKPTITLVMVFGFGAVARPKGDLIHCQITGQSQP